MPKNPIVIVLQFDCEPDLHRLQRGKPTAWEGLRQLFTLVDDWRATLNPKVPKAKMNWFWRIDPQVEECHGRADWALGEFASQIEVTRQQGDFHGLHPHAWRWSDELDAWLVDHGNWPYIEALTRQAVAHFNRAFGEPCQALRFGSEWFSPALWELERSLGICYEMGLVVDQPATTSLDFKSPTTGLIPERIGYPYLPFRQQGLWIFPNSSGALNLPEGGYGRRGKYERWRKRLGPAKAPMNEPQIMANLAFDPRVFRIILENALAKTGQRIAVLAARSDAGIDKEYRPNLEANLKLLRDHPWAKRFHFTTPAGALQALGMI